MTTSTVQDVNPREICILLVRMKISSVSMEICVLVSQKLKLGLLHDSAMTLDKRLWANT